MHAWVPRTFPPTVGGMPDFSKLRMGSRHSKAARSRLIRGFSHGVGRGRLSMLDTFHYKKPSAWGGLADPSPSLSAA